MSKFIKIILLSLILISFSSCKKGNFDEKKNTSADDVEYPTFTITEYIEMDKYEISKRIDGVEYKYTYFFKDDMCVNAKEELKFNSEESAKAFYEYKKTSEEYIDINNKGNVVTYFYSPEYFEYLMYPKDVLIELLNLVENDE